MPTHHSRHRFVAVALATTALLLGCAQLLGLKEDEQAAACARDLDCAPSQRCVAQRCSPPRDASGGAGSQTTGGSEASAGSGAAAGSETTGGSGSSPGGHGNAGGGEAGGGGDLPTCSGPEDCPGNDNECAQRTCTEGVCGIDFEDLGVVVPAQTAGDCQTAICDGNGVVSSQPDDADVPDVTNVCMVDVCADGTLSHEPAPPTTSCGGTGQFNCDGMGVCGGCTQSSDCGLDNLCATYECETGHCENTFVPSGEGNLANTAGDCKKNVCDGMGSPTTVADGADLPNDDRACTKDVCTNGNPSNPPEPNTKACGAFSTCNGTGLCVCSDPTANACARAGVQCGPITNGCGQQVTCPNTCNDGINTCNGAGNPNACGCTPVPRNCGFGQCAGSVSDGCGRVTDCSGDCQFICPDNCSGKVCSAAGANGFCTCTDCQG